MEEGVVTAVAIHDLFSIMEMYVATPISRPEERARYMAEFQKILDLYIDSRVFAALAGLTKDAANISTHKAMEQENKDE